MFFYTQNRLKRELGINENQYSQFDNLVSTLELLRDKKELLKEEANNILKKAFLNETFNNEELKGKLEKVENEIKEMLAEITNIFKQFHALLNSEQRNNLVRIISEHSSSHRRHRH